MVLMPSSSRRGRVAIWAGLVVILLAATGAIIWWRVMSKAKPDMMAALRANNQGIAHLEQMDDQAYAKAVQAFEEACKAAPDWLPARINLGIALLNLQKLGEATSLFEQILKDDPGNLYAHFCLGIVASHQGNNDEAAQRFERVTQGDPNDAAAWYWLGSSLAQGPARRMECFKKAMALDPYMIAAIYNMAMDLRQHDMEKAKALLAEQTDLKKALWDNTTKIRYSQMGHYAEAIRYSPDPKSDPPSGPIPLFARNEKLQIKLAPGARWATASDFGQDAVAQLRKRLRQRFGACMVALDYNGDGRIDVFLLSAVVEAGKVRDLLLRNDGEGRFVDVTAEAGLAEARPSVGCCVADFDNDGTPDLFITGIGQQRLFRNTGKGRFKDITKEAGLDKLNTVCTAASFLDLDQDGDLDLVVAQYATTPEEALAGLQSDKPIKGPGLAVYINIGEAPVVNPSQDPPPLKPRFQRANKPADLVDDRLPLTGLAITDLDCDEDLDLLILADHSSPEMILNDRLLRFHSRQLPTSLVASGKWNGALVLDVNRDGRSDLFLVGSGQNPILLLNQCSRDKRDVETCFEKGATDSPPLLQAQAIDLDFDGLTDVVGLSNDGKPVLLHNDGRRLVKVGEALGADKDWPPDLIGLIVADFDGDGFPDLLVWSESSGLQLRVNQKNGNHALLLQLIGHRRIEGSHEPAQSNADGIGTVITAHAADHWASLENSTLSAGLGQSRQPLVLGLGRHTQSDFVHLRWPDTVPQGEFDFPTNRVSKVDEHNRRGTSCPILFTWNGQRFAFITDFLGAGSMGELGPDGTCRPPRPEESVKIEADQNVPKDGHFIFKIAEPMNEIIYLDRLQLTVMDHPSDVRAYPDERFVSSGPPASQDLLAFRQEIYPTKARDHHGRDVTQTLRAWDRKMVDNFARRAWLGYAEEHWVELDFGDRLAGFDHKDRLVLCLAGWTDYPYPESIWAATQAGVASQPPILERLGPDGKWQTLITDMGFPAGLPRMMTVDVTGKLGGPACVVRLRTNMNVYWDQIFVAPLLERIPAGAVGQGVGSSRFLRTTTLEVEDAQLEARGCAQEFSPDGHKPTIYDHDRRDRIPMSRMSGRLTRLGPVGELLRARDDRFVIFGPGEEITVRFDARHLPALPKGWTRSFVLRIWGYTKDCGPFTATRETIEPLPFQQMSKYPYGPDEHYPSDAFHQEYLERYNTRQVGPNQRLAKPFR